MAANFRLLENFCTRFSRARSGSAALIFGLAFIPSMLGVGVAIDYGRATMMKSKLQAAADAAVLAAGAQQNLTQAKRQAIAQNKVMANLGAAGGDLGVVVTGTEPSPGVFQVVAKASVKTSVLKFMRLDKIGIDARSEATIITSGETPVEIALALDNTGSMRNDMPALKSAAKRLAQTVMSGGVKSKVRVSVVPYVAAVNPGLTDLSMVDTSMRAPTTGNWYSWAWLGYEKNCTPVWGPGGSGPGGGDSGDTSGDASDLINLLNPFRRIAQELFGVSAAFAADVTPNTIPPLTIQSQRSSATNRRFSFPSGFNLQPKNANTGGCDWVANPGTVSNYELFRRTRDEKGKVISWKGCVEARANSTEIAAMNSSWGTSYTRGVDFDVTDTPPGADVAALFTPYFWPDEPDYDTKTWAYSAPGPSSRGRAASTTTG